MIAIVWEFQVPKGQEVEFEKHYGPEGTWVELFRCDRSFKGTSLLRDREDIRRYLTIDCWVDLASYEAFRVHYAKEYQTIDSQMERLTSAEKRIGVFDLL
jgi:heme-degrading monooxygenase HmoA